MLLAIGQDVTERKQAEAALRESEQRFMDVLRTSGDAILLIDGETFVDCNEATSQMLGYSNREEFLMTHPSELSPPAQPDGRNSFEKANEMIRTAFEKGFHRFEWMHRKAGGGDFPVEVSLTPIPYKGRTILHCLWRDLTDQKRVEEKLRTLHRAVEQSSNTIVITDVDGKIEYVNPQFEVTTGYTVEEAYGQNPRVLKSGQQPLEFYAELWETISSGREWRGEFRNKRKDGSLYWEAACISPVFDAQGRITHFVAVKDDISERKRAEEQLRRASEQDSLTGVFNRRAFHGRFSQEWERAARYGHPLACVMLDLDFFKRINDTHGHATGDATLKAVAHLLRRQGRPGDISCRYGGEEFCILLPETDEAGAARWADRVRLAISETPVPVGDLSLRLAASFGVAERLADTAGPEQLVELADEALAVAKQSGRNRVVRFGSLHAPQLDPRDKQAAAGPIDGISAHDVMSVALVCPNQNDTVRHVADLFLQLRVDSAPVVDAAGTVTGIVAEADLLTRTALGKGWEDKIRDVMRTDVVCYEENTPVAQVYDFLSRVSVPRVIVVNNGRPSGVISRATLLRWLRNWVAAREPGSSEQRSYSDRECERRRAGIVKTAQAAEERAAHLRRTIVIENTDFGPCVVGEATRLQSLVNDLLGHCRSQDVL
jgi:diguanylate cyclase (GGDEF)-like protein/PAS domain S-box-containing protein